MTEENPFNSERGELNISNVRAVIYYKGKAVNPEELNTLLLIEGRKPENKDTLLGLIGNKVTADNISNPN